MIIFLNSICVSYCVKIWIIKYDISITLAKGTFTSSELIRISFDRDDYLSNRYKRTVTVPLTDLTVRDFVIRVHNVIRTVISLQLPTYRDTQHVAVIFVNYNSSILRLDTFHVVCKLPFNLCGISALQLLCHWLLRWRIRCAKKTE